MKSNLIVAVFSQNLTSVNKAGDVVEFNEEQKFMSETTQAVSARTLALWLLGQMKHFIKLQRLQGKTGFKMSKPISLALSVNNKTERLGFKFSLSLERIERLIETTPDLVQEAFTVAPTVSQIIANAKGVNDYLLTNGNAIVAKAIKAKAIEEMPMAQIEVGAALITEMIEQ